jgi:biopolymer transport protein ExbD
MVKEAQLDQSRADYLLQNFSGHFKEAAEWAKKAKDIIVTNENQTVMMEIARTGRLFLSKKRQEIEKARKWMKEPALREGQAIDKIANLLKDTIIPTEEHLRRQEDFVKLRQEAEAERIRLEVEARMEQERIAEENRKAQENARLQAENERLRNEQKKIAEENARKIAEENRKRQEELARVQAENKVKLDKERQEREKVEAELRAKKQAEQKAESDRIIAEERLLSADDQTKMITFRRAVEAIKIPEVKSAINKRIIEDAKSHLFLAVSKITVVNQEEE